MKLKSILILVFVIMVIGVFGSLICAQEIEKRNTNARGAVSKTTFQEVSEVVTENPVAKQEKSELEAETEEDISTITETASGNVTLDFKDADIRNVLRILSYKGGVNIVAGKGVEGPVTIRLTDVPWERALSVILKTYDYGYEREGNIIMVTPLEALTQKKLAEKELAEVEPLVTEVFTLRFLDANDAKKVLEPQLSGRGKLTVLEVRSIRGWAFSMSAGTGTGGSGGAAAATSGQLGYRERLGEGENRAKVVVISDIASYMEKIKKIIAQIDIMPKQILIETRIMEVSRDFLKDIGFDWGTGSSGAEGSAVTGTATSKHGGVVTSTIGIQSTASETTPAVFNPKATGLVGYEPFNTGLEFAFKKLTGTQFEIMLHALEEDVNTNTLSAPRIMTLENQDATILVGTKYPIIKQESETTETGVTVVTGGSLERYENVGVQLSVVPQTSGEKFINMIVHPAVSEVVGWEYVTGTSSGTRYPKIDVREAETQILMKDGETVVIGGLLKDVKSKGKMGIPILSDLPLIGLLFQRETTDTAKIDLLIFITARIVKPDMGKEYSYGSQLKIPTMEEIDTREGVSKEEEFSIQKFFKIPEKTKAKTPKKK